MSEPISFIRAVLSAWFLTRAAQQGEDRQVRLKAQYNRARALPNFGIRTWKSRSIVSNVKPNISVLITCFNYEDFIEKAIRSVLTATNYELEVEIIVVDDASTDKSIKILRELLSKAPIPMHVLRPLWNVGVSRARNIALSHAKAEFVFILDADNSVEPDALWRLHNLAKQTGADAAYGPIRKVLLDGTDVGMVSNNPFDPTLLQHGNYIDAMAMFRRSSLEMTGGYNVDLLKLIGGWEDYDVWLNFANRGLRVAFEPSLIGTYLVKPDSMVNSITTNEQRIAMRLFGDHYNFKLSTDCVKNER